MWIVAVAILGLANAATASIIAFSGTITQSTQDGTGPAINNPALNMIADGDAYSVTINFTGTISAFGTYPLAGVTMTFLDVTKSVSETSFTPATSTSCNVFPTICVVVTPDGTFDDISLLACLSTGSGCDVGNQLAAVFRIPAAGLTGQNVGAQAIPNLSPSLDLVEDDGITDIQGTVTTWSNGSASAVPEPSSTMLLGFALAALRIGCGANKRKEKRRRTL